MAEAATNIVRIPQRFFDDHFWRDLPTPEIVRQTKTHYFIKRDAPEWAELVSDAQHYADPTAIDCEHSLRLAAHGLLVAMGEKSTFKKGVADRTAGEG